MTTASVVIPLYNEAENIVPLYQKLRDVMEKHREIIEVLFVDDGSRDGSFDHLKNIAAGDTRIKLIRFSRNFGQTAALSAGFAEASGEVIIPMDADLQNDPADIPLLLAKLAEGYDVVSGWRRERQDKFWSRRLPSFFANLLISLITGTVIHDYGCTLKAYRKSVLEGVHLYGEMHRFIPAYAAWNGARVTEIVVQHHPRLHGVSNYGMSRVFKAVLDLLVVKFWTTYLSKPMHFFGGIGVLALFFGVIAGITAIVLKIFYHVYFIVTPLPLLTALLLILGVQFILMGLLAEILTRIYFESQQKPTYLIAERINF